MVIKLLNLIFGDVPKSTKYWNTELKQLVAKKFEKAFTEEELSATIVPPITSTATNNSTVPTNDNLSSLPKSESNTNNSTTGSGQTSSSSEQVTYSWDLKKHFSEEGLAIKHRDGRCLLFELYVLFLHINIYIPYK